VKRFTVVGSKKTERLVSGTYVPMYCKKIEMVYRGKTGEGKRGWMVNTTPREVPKNKEGFICEDC
jgi:hypothetical protein